RHAQRGRDLLRRRPPVRVSQRAGLVRPGHRRSRDRRRLRYLPRRERILAAYVPRVMTATCRPSVSVGVVRCAHAMLAWPGAHGATAPTDRQHATGTRMTDPGSPAFIDSV